MPIAMTLSPEVSVSTNCRRYPPVIAENVQAEDYVHCNGTKLKLTDSKLGSEQYSPSDYYVWPAGKRSHQLLFTFQTRVNLTTITLHYYSNSEQSLPRLRFFAVPDDFDVWEAPISGKIYAEVTAIPPDGEQACLRGVSINYKVTTSKLLMLKFQLVVVFN